MTRQIKFLIGAIIIGVLLIAISMCDDYSNVPKIKTSSNELGTNFSPLESKIKVLSAQNYKPSDFITLKAEIHSSFSSELITQAGEENLKLQLKETQTNLLFSECELFLKGASSNSKQLLQWLDDLKRNFPEESKIGYYKAQIDAYNYYTTTLPNKINSLVRIQCFDDVKSNNLKSEIQQMSRLDRNFRRKLNAKVQKLVKQIEEYRSASFENYGPCDELTQNLK
jgi:outer membrane murein-binding lipoprotein Lpp